MKDYLTRDLFDERTLQPAIHPTSGGGFVVVDKARFTLPVLAEFKRFAEAKAFCKRISTGDAC